MANRKEKGPTPLVEGTKPIGPGGVGDFVMHEWMFSILGTKLKRKVILHFPDKLMQCVKATLSHQI